MTSLFHALLGLLVEQAHAACPPFLADYAEDCAIFGTDFIAETAERITLLATGLIGGACVLGVIYGGLRILSTSVDEGGKEEGKKIVITSLIGLVLAIAAAAVVNAVALFFSF